MDRVSVKIMLELILQIH